MLLLHLIFLSWQLQFQQESDGQRPIGSQFAHVPCGGTTCITVLLFGSRSRVREEGKEEENGGEVRRGCS